MRDRNVEVANLLNTMADLLEIRGENVYRVAAYRQAAQSVEALTEPIDAIATAGDLEAVPGIGASIAAKIREFLTTGRLSAYEELSREIPPSLAELLRVPGLGPAKARKLYQALGVKSLADLKAAAEAGQLAPIPGFGQRTQERILRELGRLQERTHRLLLAAALPVAEEIVGLLRQHPAVQQAEPAGSIRRRRETVGDIDIVVASERPDEVMAAFTALPLVREVLAHGPTLTRVLTRGNLQVDLRVVAPDCYGAALLHFTGSQAHNIRLRERAIAAGYKLNEYGLFDDQTGTRIACDEAEIYRRLGLQAIPPELREDRGEIEAAAAGTLPELVELGDVRGDLHIHTDWTDGTAPLATMVEAAIRAGFEYVAVTDHSRSLGVARGLSIERVQAQWQLIDELNQRYAPFRILKGTEVDILADGQLDYPPDLLLGFDIVTASIHSSFGQPIEQMTNRILRALRTGLVDIFNHPTGRLLERRTGYEVDLEAVIAEAARQQMALEINSSPDRLDLNDEWARWAGDHGALLAVNTDSHAPEGFTTMQYGIAVARRGWLRAEQILNTRSLAAVQRFVAQRRRRRISPVASSG